MNSKHPWVATIALVLALSVADPRFPGVWAQSKDMAACPAGWEWNKNSLGQDPCVITFTLESACRGRGPYTIGPLNSTKNYTPPRKSNDYDLMCDCNTVMYSTYMACSTCQGARILSWPTWITHCQDVYVARYPHDVPYGTAIPRWAFYDITSLPNQTYDDDVAISVGRDPEEKPKPLSTENGESSTSTSGLSPTSTLPSSSPAVYPTRTNDSSGNKNITGTIVGGVVGGAVPLITLTVVVVLFVKRPRGGVSPSIQETSGYYRGQPASPTLTATSTDPPYSTYHSTYGFQGQGRYSGTPTP